MKKINWRDPKVKLAAGGAVAVGAFALYKRSSGGAALGGTSAANPAGAASALGDANLQSAVYDSLESQYTGLQAQLARVTARLNKVTASPALRNKKPASPHPTPISKPPPAKKIPIAKANPVVAKLQALSPAQQQAFREWTAASSKKK